MCRSDLAGCVPSALEAFKTAAKLGDNDFPAFGNLVELYAVAVVFLLGFFPANAEEFNAEDFACLEPGRRYAVPANAPALKEAAAATSTIQQAQYEERSTRHGTAKCYRDFVVGPYRCHYFRNPI